MAKPNVTIVVGKRKNNAKNKPTTNPFWSNINNMNPPLLPGLIQQPVRLLTEVPIGNPQPTFMPPVKPLIQLVDDNSPHIPSRAVNVQNTNIPINIATIMAANNAKKAAAIAKNAAANNTKKAAAKKGKNAAANIAKIAAANAGNKGVESSAINAAVNALANATNQPGAKKPFTNQQEKKWQRLQAKIQVMLMKKHLTWVKPEDSVTPAGDEPGTSGTPDNKEAKLDMTNQNVLSNETPIVPEGTQPPRNFAQFFKNKKKLQRKLAWQQKQAALAEVKPVNNDTSKKEEATPNKPLNEPPAPQPQGSGCSVVPITTVTPVSNQILVQNKKKLQRLLAWQQKQVALAEVTNDTPQKEEATPNKPLNEPPAPQPQGSGNSKIPITTMTPVSTQGLAIPTLDKTIPPQNQPINPRSNAVSFFKAQPLLPIRQHRGHIDIYNPFNTYPKGIPKSFLMQQQLSQDPGNPQIISPDAPIWPMQSPTNIYQPNAPIFDQTPTMAENMNPGSVPIFVQTESQVDVQQQYSPSDVYSEYNPEPCEDELSEPAGQKRLSAFQRLGPVSQPKKPKLTINLMLNKEQPVREVVNDTDDDPDRYTPVHLRQDIITSTDETVMKYLTAWPWRKNVGIRRSATARNSRSVMILEQEQMEEVYEKDNFFIQISVKGYPSTWRKERVLDAILDSVRGYSLIPCFTEFTQHECKFLTLRSRSALIILHKTGFYVHKDGVELTVTISQTDLTLNQIDFIPRIVLRKRVAMGYVDKKLNLSAFTLQDDISHFIYFPLSRVSNQSDFVQLQSVIAWEHLIELDLSHNKLTNITGFDLFRVAPRLKHINLSHNRLEKITVLLNYRNLPLKSIHLEGNPLCNDYTDPDHYVKVIRMMFPAIVEIDGVPVTRTGEIPQLKQNYCPEEAQEIAEKFLEIFFPLLDSGADHRSLIQGLYEDDATLTITYCYQLRYGPIYRCFRNLFLYARFLDEGETDSVVGAMSITKLINRWPHTEHDPFTFTVDVMYHSESTTILRIGGILKLTAETLAEDEHLLSFTRTVVLYSEDGGEYKIQNEMVYWDEPTAAYARTAFRCNTISQKNFNLKIESTTDEDLRQKFLKIFMKLTTMDKKISEKCLEVNNWNLKVALEHFTKLLKLNNLDSLLIQDVQVTN